MAAVAVDPAAWEFTKEGEALQTSNADNGFTFTLPEATETNDGDFAGISQTLELSKTNAGLSFDIKDSYTGATSGYHWMEIVLDDTVIWEADVAGGTGNWRTISLDLSRYLETPKLRRIGREKYVEDNDYDLTFRLIDRRGVTRFGIQVWADNFKLLSESPESPQNCEKKKVPPRLRELMVYYDKEDLIQPITEPEHFRIKRQQIVNAMSEAMGDLPERPKRERLEDFQIHVENSQIRGRYTKKTISFEAAPNETVHAFLYEPLDLQADEKRPGIVGMHPTGGAGKGCFESWPLCNFPIELAMMGYVVIIPDYPGFGDLRSYDFDTDRYESGTIKGVFSHMVCVDFLQAHPNVDPEKIGTIGHSLGGHNAMFLAAFDERVKIAVSSCGWTPFEYYETVEGRLKTWALPNYMPLLDSKFGSDHRQFPFDFHEVAAAIAPRVFFSSSPTGDGVFPGWGPKAAAPYIRKFYQAQNAELAFQFHQPLAQHRFPWDTRHEAYRAINDTLNYHFHGDLGLLAERDGEAAIPALKKALSDSDPMVRWAASALLAQTNDRSGLTQLRADFNEFASNQESFKHALELAAALAELGDSSGYELAAELAISGSTHGQRWRAAIVLARLSNLDSSMLAVADMNPTSVLKTMAAEETHEGVFFVLIDQVHKILTNRTDMIDIFASAKGNEHHSQPPPGNRHSIAQIFHEVAVRDKDKTWR
ncbi:MAG: putative dienelactone hydrolase [Verrucomicrobiales bacterium]|jgi:predicted dienelactone hydrolase